MNIAIIKDNICTNVAVFADLQTAQDFLKFGVWPGVDAVAELPEGYGIGDTYRNGKWIKAPQPDPQPEPEVEPSYKELIEAINILTGGRDDELDDIISSNGA